MPRATDLPSELCDRVFTIAEAECVGLSRRVLQGRRFELVMPGVYRYAATQMTFELGVAASARYLPPEAAISHVSSLRWRGLSMRSSWPVHASVKGWSRKQQDGITVHRYFGRIDAEVVRGVRVLGPERTFVDCGTLLSVRELVEVGDWLVQSSLATLESLFDFTTRSHLDGVQRARKALHLVRVGTESPPESGLRFVLVSAGLPEPEVNTDIVDDRGTFLARGDLVYRTPRVIVEYDGWYHERSAEQRQSDILRRERLEAAGWRLIIVTAIDMKHPVAVAERVRRALG